MPFPLLLSKYLTGAPFSLTLQHPGAAQGEVEGRGEIAARKGELRVLRASQDAPSAGSHHQPAGQGLDHKTDHQLPEAEGFLRTRRSAMDSGSL